MNNFNVEINKNNLFSTDFNTPKNKKENAIN